MVDSCTGCGAYELCRSRVLPQLDTKKAAEKILDREVVLFQSSTDNSN